MIPKSVIQKYLHRPVDDHRWMKSLKAHEIDELIAELRPRPKLYKGMLLHQKVTFYLGVTYPQFSFWLDMGSGKTLLSLELIKYWFRVEEMRKALVFVLSDKAFEGWERQAREFDINLPVYALEGSSVDKWHTLRQVDHGIVLATYPGAVAMCSEKMMKKVGRRKKMGLALVKERLDELAEDTGVFIMDESTKAGHSTSLIYKMCQYLTRQIPIRYALAGLPFGRDPMLLFNQQYLIDRGDTFGLKGLFKEAFFSKSKNHFGTRFSYDFKFKKSMAPELSRLMQHRSITYEEGECVELPKIRFIREPVKFSKDSQLFYQEAVKALATAQGSFKETKNIFLRMRQITSGFLGFKDDETGERAQIAFDRNPKLEALMNLVDELPENRKAVIFYEFTWSAKQMVAQFKERKFKFSWLWSGTQDSRKELHQFFNDDEYRFIIIQNKVGSYSLDGLQKVANYGFIYESPVPVIDRKQLERRLARQGQSRRVFLYDLVVPQSVDERILEFHKEGKDLMDAVRKDYRVLT